MATAIVKTYGPPEAPTHPGPGTRYYAQKYKSGQCRPAMEMGPEEAGAEEVRRARAYELEHGTGFKAALAVIREDDPVLFRQAHPLPEQRGEPSQAERAAAHQDQLAATYIRTGQAKTLLEARRMADTAAPDIAAKAGAAPLAPLRPPEAKAYAGSIRSLNDALGKLKNLTEDDVVALLVDLPGRGELVLWQDFLRQWCILVSGRYPVGQAPRGPAVDASNALQEKIWQTVRQERLRRKGYMD